MNILVDGQVLYTAEKHRGIGVYFLNTLNNMVKQSLVHKWFLAIADTEVLDALDPWVKDRIIPVVDYAFMPGTDYSREKEYTEKLKSIVAEKKIEAYWNPDPLMVNVLFPVEELNCKMIITVFDLIPLVLSGYEWPELIKREYNRRLSCLGKWKTVIAACISRATADDVEKYINCEIDKRVICLGADTHKFYRPCHVHQSNQFSIVFTGGFDYRKNMFGALETFGKAFHDAEPGQLIKKTHMYFICSKDPENEREFKRRAVDLEIEDNVELTGYISDEELTDLYASCDVFFFPSLYEGFGLPIIEAMLCGAFILSADNSSLPEVCSDYALFCDAEDIDDMAEKLIVALDKSLSEPIEDKIKRQKYACGFTWEKTSSQMLELFEYEDDAPIKKIAVITPVPPQKTGIAAYMYKLLPYLSKYYEIDLFVDTSVTKLEDCIIEDKHGIFRIEELDDRYQDYYQLIYEIGNNAVYHKKIYQYLKKYPGIAEIHDYNLNPFFYHSFYLKGEKEEYKNALEKGYGAEGKNHFVQILENHAIPDDESFPMIHSVAAVSTATIVHNMWSLDRLRDECKGYMIPLACFKTRNSALEDVRKKYAIKDDDILISCFGFINENKRPEIIVQAAKKLINSGYHIKLIFWGENSTNTLEKTVKNAGLTDSVIITGYVDDDVYYSGMLRTDIVINLRFPTMGESSGTLCDAFVSGKPVIVSEINQYSEFPNEVCWKVQPGIHECELLTEMLAYLIDHEDVRRALGENAKAYSEYVLSPERISQYYCRAIIKSKEL